MFRDMEYMRTHPVVLRLPDSKSGDVAVPAPPLVVRVLLNELPSLQIGTVKRNDQLILAVLFQSVCHLHSLGDEHVVRFENCLAVENNSSERVEAIKGQDRLCAIVHLRAGKRCLVDPDTLADPLDVKLILADEGVGDEFVVEQIQVDVGGELGDGEVRVVLFVGLFELPILVNGRYSPANRRHLAGARG
jgi:hypothetical protein